MTWQAEEFKKIRGIGSPTEEDKKIKTALDGIELLKEIRDVCTGETQVDVYGDTEALQWIADRIDEAL